MKRDTFFNVGWMQLLTIGDYPELVNDIYKIIDDREITFTDTTSELVFAKCKQKLLDEMGSISKVRYNVRRNVLTSQLNEINKEIKDHFISFKSFLKSEKRRPAEAKINKSAQILLEWMKAVAPEAPHCSHTKLKRYVKVMSDDLVANPTIGEALILLSASTRMTDLINLNDEYDNVLAERDSIAAENDLSKIDVKQVRADTHLRLKEIFIALNLIISWGEYSDVEALVLNLQKTIERYHSPHKARQTMRLRGSEDGGEGGTDVGEEQKDEKPTPTNQETPNNTPQNASETQPQDEQPKEDEKPNEEQPPEQAES